jgi:hypothetical protein
VITEADARFAHAAMIAPYPGTMLGRPTCPRWSEVTLHRSGCRRGLLRARLGLPEPVFAGERRRWQRSARRAVRMVTFARCAVGDHDLTRVTGLRAVLLASTVRSKLDCTDSSLHRLGGPGGSSSRITVTPAPRWTPKTHQPQRRVLAHPGNQAYRHSSTPTAPASTTRPGHRHRCSTRHAPCPERATSEDTPSTSPNMRATDAASSQASRA